MITTRRKIFFGMIAGTTAIITIGLMSYSPQRAAHYEKEQRVDAACDQMLNDSAPGDERRLTQAICKRLKENVRAERYSDDIHSLQRNLTPLQFDGLTSFVAVEPFTVNLVQEEQDQYLQTQFKLKVDDEKQAQFIYRNMSQVRSRVLLLLSKKKASEIVSPSGKNLLAQAILEEINKPFHGESYHAQVKELVFTKFKIE